MNIELKDSLQKLSENEDLSRQLKDLFESNPENFAENCLKILNENGIMFSKEDLSEQEISLQELEQVAGGNAREDDVRYLLEYFCGQNQVSSLG